MKIIGRDIAFLRAILDVASKPELRDASPEFPTGGQRGGQISLLGPVFEQRTKKNRI